MIIDAHTRTWPGLDHLGVELSHPVRELATVRPFDASAAALELATQRIDGAIVLGFRADRVGAFIPNDAIVDVVRQGNGRYVGVAGIDPTTGDAMDEYARCRSAGLFGVCVSPAMQGFLPSDDAPMRVFERCATDGIPVFVSRPAPYTRNAVIHNDRPTLWTETLRSFPKLTVVFSGIGWPWTDECLAVLGAFKNTWADTSGLVSQPWSLFNVLHSASHLRVIDRIVFASGWPYESPAKAAEALYGMNNLALGTPLPTLPRSTLRAIVDRDTFQALGIPDPASLIRQPTDARLGFLGRTAGGSR